jgi:hypothetical protein
MPVNKETFPTSFRTLGLRLIPTMNKSKATPICAKIEIEEVSLTMLRIYGLTRIPVNIYPIISGCFNNLVIAVTSIAIKIIILILQKMVVS